MKQGPYRSVTVKAIVGRPPLIVMAFMLGVLPLLVVLCWAQQAGAEAVVLGESDLNAGGVAYEINADLDGLLWISDYTANEIRQINPATNVYTAYQELHGPSDARRDAAGNVWWTDYDNNRVGRINANTMTATTWSLTGSGVAWGTAVDDAGYLWMSDSIDSLIYRFDPGTSQLCAYVIPGGGASDYIVANGGDIWLGDYQNERIVRFNASADLFTFWSPGSGAYPRGILAMEDGDFWWADRGLGILAKLEPDINQMTSYTPPVGSWPMMISDGGGIIWYTEIGDTTFGALDPQQAAQASTTLSPTMAAASAPSCENILPDTVSSVLTDTGVVSWTAMTYAKDITNDGWVIYESPAGGFPWGIAADDGQVWTVDSGRAKLVRLQSMSAIFLPLVIK